MKYTKVHAANQKKQQMKSNIYIVTAIILIILSATSCQLFNKHDEGYIDIPTNLTQEKLQDMRYKYKRDKSYQQTFLYQNKTSSAIVTIYKVISYQIKDEQASNIGEGFDYYIFDISVDNPNSRSFNIGNFSKSCRLTNEDPQYMYSNVGFALKIFYLQSDSSEIDMEYTKRFYLEQMPAKEFYRTRLFAFEVSKDDKNALYFRYNIGSQQYAYKVRDSIQ